MGNRQIMNITALTICAIVCVILLACLLASEGRKDKATRIIILMLAFHLPLLLVDIPIFYLEGSNDTYAGHVLRAATFLSFTFGNLFVILAVRYLIALIELRGKASRVAIYIFRVIVALCALNMLGIVLTPFFDLFYFIGSDNFLGYGSLYWLNQLWAGTCGLLYLVIVISHRKILGTKMFLFFLSHTVLPTMAVLIHNLLMDGVNASLNVANTLTLLVFYSGIQNEVHDRLKQNELDAQISIMLSQIQPHFLYNSLTAIEDLCKYEPTKAKTAIHKFARYLRGNMDSLSQKKLIPFEKEMEHIRHYIWLEEMRFRERLKVTYDIQSMHFLLPALTIQPIIENAVKHGVTKRREGGMVTIATEETNDGIVITIKDDGIGFDPEETRNDGRSHTGLENVRNRLTAMCGGTLEIQSQADYGTTATIRIPKGTEEK